MTLLAIHNKVKASANRGTTLDALIPDAVADAVKWLEATHTFLHMERFAEFEIDSDGEYPRTISMPTGWKSTNFLRLVLPGSNNNYFRYLREVDPIEVNSYAVDEHPQAYWRDGVEYFWLDGTPTQDYTGEISYNAYTVLPENTALSAKILDRYPRLVTASAIVLLGPDIRDDKMVERYKMQRDEWFQTVINAEEEAKIKNKDEAMQYGWQHREGQNA